jgi:hypothetical protein
MRARDIMVTTSWFTDRLFDGLTQGFAGGFIDAPSSG